MLTSNSIDDIMGQYNSESAWKNLDSSQRQDLNAIGMKHPTNQDYIHNIEGLLSKHILKKEIDTI